MPVRRLYALTRRQAHLLQHAIEDIEDSTLYRSTIKTLEDAWQSLSRPITLESLSRPRRKPQAPRKNPE